jgi:hypothetical protein
MNSTNLTPWREDAKKFYSKNFASSRPGVKNLLKSYLEKAAGIGMSPASPNCVIV